MAKDTHEALSGLIVPALCFRLIITGIDPIISITAKSTMLTFNISTKSNFKGILTKLDVIGLVSKK